MAAQEQRNLYEVIGCEPTATPEEIRKAYHKKAMILHPDRNRDDPHATEKFQELSEAYSILSDPEKRSQYDRFGLNGEEPQTQEDIEAFEVLTQILGLGRSRGAPKGDKVSPTIRLLTVPDNLVYSGGKMTKKIKVNIVCPECLGVGSNNGIEYPECDQCHGAGSLSPGGLQFLFPCENCHNVGYMTPPECVCRHCHGRKIISVRKEVEIPIEAGIQDQETIVIPEAGDEYPRKKSADLMFIVSIDYKRNFFREGEDLYYVKNLSNRALKEGVCFSIDHPSGKTLNVYTPDGKPIDPMRLLWLEGYGMPAKGHLQSKGNLYILFRPVDPGLIREGFMNLRTAFHSLKKEIELTEAPEEIQQAFQLRIQEAMTMAGYVSFPTEEEYQ